MEQVLEATPHKKSTVWPPTTIMKTIKVTRTRQTGHSWRSKDELISDILLWTPSHGWAKVWRPARTYIQQLCVDTGYSLEDLLGAMDEIDEWRERVREIHAGSAIWWWWWWFLPLCVFLFLIINIAHFSMSNSIPISLLFELESPILFHFFF